ncbi:MAG: 30S ribosomal protein S8 [bacterium]|nr:30S ribosomal protein S8 [bacterium]
MIDTIADMLTRIRNAYMAKKTDVSVPYSKFKHSLANVLVAEGWVKSMQVREEAGIKNLLIELKYLEKGEPAVLGIKMVSKPGQRIYVKNTNIPRVLGGLGVTIVSTSRGIMTDKVARKQRVGGEIICQVW